jgi:hypothetical protein
LKNHFFRESGKRSVLRRGRRKIHVGGLQSKAASGFAGVVDLRALGNCAISGGDENAKLHSNKPPELDR